MYAIIDGATQILIVSSTGHRIARKQRRRRLTLRLPLGTVRVENAVAEHVVEAVKELGALLVIVEIRLEHVLDAGLEWWAERATDINAIAIMTITREMQRAVTVTQCFAYDG